MQIFLRYLWTMTANYVLLLSYFNQVTCYFIITEIVKLRLTYYNDDIEDVHFLNKKYLKTLSFSAVL